MIVIKPYDRERAVEYALTWALDRNPLFLNFTGRGGDCTNFASQCLLAGSCTMEYTPDFGWYYISSENRAPAWTGVEFFYDFVTEQPIFAENNTGIGPYGREVGVREARVGDFIQLADEEGDYYHTLVITGFEPGDILISAHSDDAKNRRLSTYNYSSLRYIHIDGVRVNVADDICFEPLLEGIAIDVAGPDTEPVPLAPEPIEGEATLETPPESDLPPNTEQL